MKAIGEVITKYRKKYGLSQAELSQKLKEHGISVSIPSVCCWERNASTPNAVQFLTLCEILNITDIYQTFIGEPKTKKSDPFAGLNQRGIERAMEYIHLLSLSDEFRQLPDNVIPFERYLPHFTIPVSAGLGEFLDGNNYENIPVPPEVPEQATFALTVSGDSMEPKFNDKQIVWVERIERINHDEIGIFCLNGEAYIKKLQDDKNGVYLISLNKRYKPIPVKPDDSFRILGRVLM